MGDEKKQSAYAGRWVARLHGHIIAQGGTPELARRAALSARHKESPEIIYMPFEFSLPPLVNQVRAVLPDQEIYLVGGAVRDMLLGRASHDLDFAVPAKAIPLARRVADALDVAYVTLDEEHDTGRIIHTSEDGTRTYLDFASFRGRTLEEDLRDRDFTINALALDLQQAAILDPLEGAADLRAKRIRACSPTALSADPIRILRAVRQAAAFGFQIEKETREWMRQAVGQLGQVSPERQRDELFKMLDGPKPDASIRALEMLGVLPQLLPELSALKGVVQSPPHVYDVWTHTLAVLQHLDGLLAALDVNYNPDSTNDLYTGLLTLRIGRYREQITKHIDTPLTTDRSARALLLFAALYHDVRKPQTRSVEEGGRIRFFDHEVQGAEVAAERAQALRLSTDELHRLRIVIRNHMRFHFHTSRMDGEGQSPSRRAIYRFFRESGAAGTELILLGLADLRATHGPSLKQETWSAALDVARVLLENYWEKPQETIAPPRLLDGHDLMRALELKPGPAVGEALEAIREAQATGKVSTREEALEFGKHWLEEQHNSS
ncbi:MAG: HD domain-containing protein [Chloroflexi bacterium]|nr:HD domain-containing protein [Chloroflexota bacterium]